MANTGKLRIEWLIGGEWSTYATVECSREEAQRMVDGAILATRPDDTLHDPARWRVVSVEDPGTVARLTGAVNPEIPATLSFAERAALRGLLARYAVRRSFGWDTREVLDAIAGILGGGIRRESPEVSSRG